jgi:hypothetical protein
MGALIRNGHDNFLDVKDEEVPTCRHTRAAARSHVMKAASPTCHS